MSAFRFMSCPRPKWHKEPGLVQGAEHHVGGVDIRAIWRDGRVYKRLRRGRLIVDGDVVKEGVESWMVMQQTEPLKAVSLRQRVTRLLALGRKLTGGELDFLYGLYLETVRLTALEAQRVWWLWDKYFDERNADAEDETSNASG